MSKTREAYPEHLRELPTGFPVGLVAFLHRHPRLRLVAMPLIVRSRMWKFISARRAAKDLAEARAVFAAHPEAETEVERLREITYVEAHRIIESDEGGVTIEVGPRFNAARSLKSGSPVA